MTEQIASETLKEMKYSEHLKELRKRLIYSIGAVIAIFLLLLPVAQQNYHFLAQPLISLLPSNSTMIATDVMSTFLAPFKLNIYLAILVSIPFILYQFWRFLAPALYQNEKKFGITLALSSIFLFYLGLLFAYGLILPLALKFFMLASPENVLPMTDINSYLDFCLKLFLAFGLAFQIPVLTYILIFIGILSIHQLEEHRKHIIVFFFFIAMFITPPDIFSMLALAVPMWLLFELGLWITKLTTIKKEHP
ncbi:twin-arginine translocase subunit TatC [Acinetobacter sp. VNH17]|uniref:Sec-independent protein translocase protein TatC n=1 Tax=Acinetobacter thutiue TaxID=2998078 RepID=A0ABT7WLW4_9GAMM|nr:twin-arginine translocase subunit TatC [Acinetobacter thutiue]MCY6411577.1 twin-arginine translocase subunit TatC [Acinetobacter thutiue]MDN0013679.1 twin-arginine translocase subunit TatC [Acinetobacter thutiue]